MKLLFVFSISFLLISCKRAEINGLPENYITYVDLQDSLGNNLFNEKGVLIDSNLKIDEGHFDLSHGWAYGSESCLIYRKSDTLFEKPIPVYHGRKLFSGYLCPTSAESELLRA